MAIRTRIVISIQGGVAALEAAENWPKGLELYTLDYDDPQPADTDCIDTEFGICSVSSYGPREDFDTVLCSEVARKYHEADFVTEDEDDCDYDD